MVSYVRARLSSTYPAIEHQGSGVYLKDRREVKLWHAVPSTNTKGGKEAQRGDSRALIEHF